jgi:predicted transcriptional regulator YdeE
MIGMFEIIIIPAYRAIGLKWEGPYNEVVNLKKVIDEMSGRVKELEYAVQPEIQLGLSYHLRPDGFVHYSVYEVDGEQQIPVGMVDIHVPEMTCLKVHHNKGQNIGQTYSNIHQWVKENDYVPYVELGVEYYDDLPIKYERYPSERDLQDPHFDILIPIVLKK